MSDANPYVGPRPFEQADAAAERYYGREREALDLLALVSRERLVLFYSQSGAGKSSLLRASLIPGLQTLGFDVLPLARVSGALLPAAGPMDAPAANPFVYNLIASLNEGLPAAKRSTVDLVRTSLAEFLGGPLAPDTQATRGDSTDQPVQETVGEDLAPTVLLIDQFEEIITSDPNRWQERRVFFEQLSDAMQRLPRLWVVLTLREEYVGPLEPYAELMTNRLRARYYMQRMGVEAALEAVSRPAAAFGRPFAAGVAATLVDNLRLVRAPYGEEQVLGQYVEPVQLQVVCYRLWEQLAQQVQPAAGTAAGAAPAIEEADLPLDYIDQALTWFYRDALAGALADPAVADAGVDERQLRRWFDREAITASGIRYSVLRDEQSGRTGSLPNAAIAPLLRRYILRAELRAGASWIEVVHDRFVEPIRDDNNDWFPKHMSALQRQAILWRDEGKPIGLLLKGQALKQAAQWAATHMHEIEPLEQEFLSACASDAQRARRTRWAVLATVVGGIVLLFALWALQEYQQQSEAKQQQIQLEAAKQRLAEAAAAAARYAKTIEWASQERSAAQAERKRALALADIAQSRQLAAESARMLEAGQLQPALLTALVAHAMTRTAESDRALSLVVSSPLAAGRVLFAGGSEYISVAWNGDGSRILADELHFANDEQSIWQGNTLRLFDAAGAGLLLQIPQVLNWQWNQAKTRLLVATLADGIQLWDAQNSALLVQFEGHSKQASSLAWDEDESRVLAVANDAAHIWDAASGAELLRFAHAGEPIASAAWNPNGTRLLSWAKSGAVRIWDAATGKQLLRLGDEATSTFQPLWNADGTRLLTADEDGLVVIWDAATGDRLRELRGGGAPPVYAAWNNTGSHVLVLDQDSNCLVWRLDASEPVLELPDIQEFDGFKHGPNLLAIDRIGNVVIWDMNSGAKLLSLGRAQRLALSPDRLRFLTWNADGLQVYEYPSGRLLASLAGSLDDTVEAEWLDATGDIVTQHWDGSLQLWNAQTGELRSSLPGASLLSWFYGGNVAQSPDGGRLVSAFGDHVVRVWDIMAAPPLARLQDAEQAEWRNNDTQVLTWSDSGAVALWAADGALHLQVETGDKDLRTAWLTSDERQIVTESSAGMLQVWDVADSARRLQVKDATSTCPSPDHKRIAAIGADGFLRVWDMASGEEQVAFAVEANECQWSQHGGRLAAWEWSGRQPTMRVWDMNVGTEVAAIETDADVFNPRFNPDMSRVLFNSYRESLQVVLWDVDTNTELTRVAGDAQWNRDGTQALISVNNGGGALWHAQSGQTLRTWPEGRAFTWTLDDTAVASSSADGVITLWDAGDGRRLRSLPGHIFSQEIGHAFVVEWSKDLRRLLTVDELATLRIWDVASGALLDQFVAPYGLTWSYTLNADGAHVLAQGDNGALLRDVEARRDLLRLDKARSVQPDATWGRLLVVNRDGSVHMLLSDWDVLAEKACAQASINLRWAEWQRLLPDKIYHPTCLGALIPPDVVEGVSREARSLYSGGDEDGARARIEALNGWLAASHQKEHFGVDFDTLIRQ